MKAGSGVIGLGGALSALWRCRGTDKGELVDGAVLLSSGAAVGSEGRFSCSQTRNGVSSDCDATRGARGTTFGAVFGLVRFSAGCSCGADTLVPWSLSIRGCTGGVGETTIIFGFASCVCDGTTREISPVCCSDSRALVMAVLSKSGARSSWLGLGVKLSVDEAVTVARNTMLRRG